MILYFLASTKPQEFKEGAYFGLAIGLVIIAYVLVKKYAKRS
jgi:hypothetical protein